MTDRTPMTETEPTVIAGQTAKETPLYLHVLIMVLVLLPCIAVSQFAAHGEAAIIDDHLYAFCGWRIWQGGTMYLDVWDHKPPGIHWIDALGFAVGGGRYAGIIALCTLATIASYALFFAVARSVYHRGTAALATILAGLYLAPGLYFGGSNRSETFLVPCELALILFYLSGFKRDRRYCWYVAGLFGGGAFLFKQTGLAASGAAGLHMVMLLLVGELPWRAVVRRAGLMLGGFATVVLTTILVLAAQDALGEAWFAVFTYNRLFLAHDQGHWFNAWWWSRWVDRYVVSVLRLPLLMALAAGVHAGLWRLRPRFRPPDVVQRLRPVRVPCAHTMSLFGMWFLLALGGAVASPASMGHHFLATMPPLLLLGAYLINVLKTELGLLRRFAQRAWVIVAFVVLGYFASDAAYLQYQKAAKVYWDRSPRFEHGQWAVDKTASEQVGEEIARVTEPDDTLQCWDYVPAVYLRARRPNASRFLTAGFGSRVPPNSTTIDQEFHETLRRSPPKVIVMRANTYRELCGTDPGLPAREATPTGQWLDAHYRRVPEMTRGDLYVFMRKRGHDG